MHPTATTPQKARRRWLRRILVLFIVWLAAQTGINLWLKYKKAGAGRVHRSLTRQLETTFGREVDVGFFQLSFFGRPQIEANFVTVAEDPRFGSEHFLRAERVAAGLRWRALLLGRLELGTIAFTRPSLNLVRNEAGEWNLASWLPAPAGERAMVGPPVQGQGRIYRIEVSGGRVNFKQGPDKHPFALVEVEGTVEQESPGQWRVDLESDPMRSTVALQEAGTLRVRGRIGSTAARLRPAELQVTWIEASLADLLRLARGRDFGIRGGASLDFTARTPGEPFAPWTASGVARLRGIHRWDLSPRATDPAVNLHFDAGWKPGTARIALTRGVFEGPGSTIRAVGSVAWEPGGPGNATDLRFTSSGIAVSDLFAWYRAFRPNVAGNVVMEGNAGVDVHLAGWPPRIEQGVLAVEGARLRVPGLSVPVSASRVLIRWERGALVMAPVHLEGLGEAPPQILPPEKGPGRRAARSGPPTPAWRLSGRAVPQENRFELNLAGRIERAQDVLAALGPLGWTTLAGWTVQSAATVNLAWRGSFVPFHPVVSGTIEPRRLALRPPFLNQPIVFQEGLLEFAENGRRVRVGAAEAFGTRWSGVLLRGSNERGWNFTLSAPRLDVAEMSRWFAAPIPGGLLAQLGARAGVTPRRESIALEARGRIEIGQLVLAPLTVQRLRARAELVGEPWSLRLTGAQADFYGGTMAGALHAESGALPVYRFEGKVENTNLDALTAATRLGRRFAGTASGDLQFEARGRDREALLASLAGQGSVEIRGAQIRGFDLAGEFQNLGAPGSRVPASAFSSATGRFTVGARNVKIEHLTLLGPRAEFEATGPVDFSQALDLTVEQLPPRLAARKPAAAEPTARRIRITGTLAAPQAARIAAAPR